MTTAELNSDDVSTYHAVTNDVTAPTDGRAAFQPKQHNLKVIFVQFVSVKTIDARVNLNCSMKTNRPIPVLFCYISLFRTKVYI